MKRVKVLSIIIIAIALFSIQHSLVYAAGINVQMCNNDITATTSSLGFRFKIINQGTTSVNLQDVKIRYYFTVDGEKAQSFYCDHAGLMHGWEYIGLTSNITGKFVKMSTATEDADYYLEIGFNSTAGTLPAGATIDIVARIAKNDWTNYNQTNDYSFNSSSTGYTDTDKIVVFLKDNKVSGVIPGSTPPTLTAGTVTRTSDTTGTVKFTSDVAGEYYYEVVADGAAVPTMVTSGAGITCGITETTITDPTGLSAGAKDIYIVVKEAVGNVSIPIKLDIPAYVAPDTKAPTLTAGTVTRSSDTAGIVKFTSDEAGEYYYEVVADGATVPTMVTSGAGINCDITETTITDPTGLSAGAKDIYIVEKDAAGNVSIPMKLDIPAFVAPDTTAPVLTAGTVTRISDRAGIVKFTSDEAGEYYYEVVADGAPAPAMVTSGAGINCDITETTITNPTGLSAGAKDIYLVVKDAMGNVSIQIKIDIPAYIAPIIVPTTGTPTGTPEITPTQNHVDTETTLSINGKSEELKATINKDDNKAIIVTLDDKNLEEILLREGDKPVIIISNTSSDMVSVVLSAQSLKNMNEKYASIEIKTGSAIYSIQTAQINIDNILQQFGSNVELKDIKLNISIAKTSDSIAKAIEITANKNNYQVIAKPVEFRVTATYDNKTVEVNKFSSYVERTIPIPDGVDASRTITGIVLNSDGSFSHVPTKIVDVGGKYYAKINSLTNSTYTVIYNLKLFKDVENHWAKNDINDMGARIIIAGVNNENFEPNSDITRAEFVEIVVNGLGLMRTGTGKDSFSDVKQSEWYYDAVSIAYEYGIITGCGNGLFEPNKEITREEAMTIISQAMSITGIDNVLTDIEIADAVSIFKDNSNISKWAKKHVAACVKTGIIVGNNEKVAAKQNITRAEAVVIVRRLLQKSNLIL